MSELERKWREIIGDWEKSGENQRAYSRRVGHPASQLSYWSRRLEHLDQRQSLEPKPQQKFVELELKSAESKSIDSAVELEFRSGLVLRIRG